MSVTLENIKSVLTNIINGVNNDTFRESDRFINQFQRLNECWSISFQLANDTNPNFAYYGCFFLKNKIRNDFEQLPENDQQELKTTLFNLCYKFVDGPNNCRSTISQAFAAYSMQCSKWFDPITCFVVEFTDVSKLPILVELLNALAECLIHDKNVIAVSKENYCIFQERMRNYSKDIISLLTGLIDKANGNTYIIGRIFNCFTAWIRIGDIKPEEIKDSPLLKMCFDSLNSEELFSPSLQSIRDIAETYNDNENRDFMAELLPVVLQYTGNLFESSVQNNDDRLIEEFSKLYAELAEGVFKKLCEEANDNYLKLVNYMYIIMSNGDEDINNNAYSFWIEFLEVIVKSDNRVQLFKYYGDILKKLYIGLIPLVLYPENFFDFDKNGQYDWLKNRKNYREVLVYIEPLDPVSFYLPEIEQLYTTGLQQYITNRSNWRYLECSLYLCRSVAGYFVKREINDFPQLFIKIFQQLPSLAVLDKTDEKSLNCSAKIVMECINIFGAYARIISKDINLFKSLFEMLFKLLEDKISQRSISRNMYNILPSSCEIIFSNEEIFNKILLLNENQKIFSTTDQKAMALSFTRLINKCVNEKRLELLERFLSTPVNELRNYLLNDSVDSYLIASCYIRIYKLLEETEIVVASPENDPRLAFFQGMYDTIIITFQKYYNDSPVIDKVCTLIRTIMRVTGVGFIPYLDNVINLLEEYYKVKPSCGLLYPIGIMGEMYGDIPQVQEKLLNAFNYFTVMTMQTYPSLEIGTENPEVIEDYFNTAMKYIRGFGKDFLHIPNVERIFDYSLQMLSIQENYCYVSVCFFIESFLNIPYSVNITSDEEKKTIKKCIIEIINTRTALICNVLSNSFINQPTKNLLSDDGSLSSILTVLIPHYYEVIKADFETYFIKPIKDVLGNQRGVELVRLLTDPRKINNINYVKYVIKEYVKYYRSHIH